MQKRPISVWKKGHGLEYDKPIIVAIFNTKFKFQFKEIQVQVNEFHVYM